MKFQSNCNCNRLHLHVIDPNSDPDQDQRSVTVCKGYQQMDKSRWEHAKR